MLHGRNRTTTALTTLAVSALLGTVVSASPTFADPEIDNVQARVDRLYNEAEQASERYNDARLELTDTQERLTAVQADLDRQRGKVEAVRAEVAAAVVSDYQGQALSSTAQVLLSDDPDSFLDQLSTVSGFNDQRAEMMASFVVAAKQLRMREAAAQREVDRIAATKADLAREKAQIDDKAAEATDLLERLEARARAEARASREADRAAAAAAAQEASDAADAAAAAAAAQAPAAAAEPATTTPATTTPAPSTPAPSTPAPSASGSGRAGAAVSYALAQVGDAYVYGATGDSAFDCSGLTMRAWAAAGVSLPHSSSAQMGAGARVSSSSLAPGDLVFYYSPVSHVGIYIGGGQVVHAANPSTGVQVAPVFSMPFSGAVRPG